MKKRIHITDEFKGEIPILCTEYTCSERGEYQRCYMKIFKDCERFPDLRKRMKRYQ